MILEELIQQLARLQAERKDIVDAANSDLTICRFGLEIRDLKSTLAAVVQAQDECKAPYHARIAEVDSKAGELETQIIEEWDGEKKTLQGDGWVLKFRTTQSLNVLNGGWMLGDLVNRFDTRTEVMEYISGFNKTKLKAYISIHPQPADVIEMIPKTTVKLEVEG